MKIDPFAPTSTKALVLSWIKQFFMVWAVVLIPVVGSVALLVYRNNPLLGVCAGYGALVTLIALARQKKNTIEITKDLQVKTISVNPIHPELLKYTLILNAIFAVESILIYIAT